ncbi:MAG: PilZ domain-containing protein [Treponema sp.]|nr:PilZ domain-containing protein [Spirochaetia bacterium]MDD7014221.1 PilZ domain-containing protein [Spirochaetales bacterium]MDY4901883.1 PilZ domain-containing protein [Treponema sp.]
MKKYNRKEKRFIEIGKVECPQLCAFSAVLEDVSASGCKIRFPVKVNIDNEKDYVFAFKFPRKNIKSEIDLMCHPQWSVAEENQTIAGFSFLTSPDTPEFLTFISELQELNEDKNDIQHMIISSQISFI